MSEKWTFIERKAVTTASSFEEKYREKVAREMPIAWAACCAVTFSMPRSANTAYACCANSAFICSAHPIANHIAHGQNFTLRASHQTETPSLTPCQKLLARRAARVWNVFS